MHINSIKINQILSDGTVQKFEGELQMEILQEIIGDGNTKITLSNSQSDKDFGNGVETFLSVTLTCGQNKKDIEIALDIARSFINEKLPTIHSEGIGLWAQNKVLNKEILKS